MIVVKPEYMVSGKKSIPDLTLVSYNIASKCEWKVYKEGTIGSDHYPLSCKIIISDSPKKPIGRYSRKKVINYYYKYTKNSVIQQGTRPWRERFGG